MGVFGCKSMNAMQSGSGGLRVKRSKARLIVVRCVFGLIGWRMTGPGSGKHADLRSCEAARIRWMDGLAFGPGWTFGNRDGVSWRETFGWNRTMRRHGDREASRGGTIRSIRAARGFILRDGFGNRSDWQADRGGKRVKPWVCLDWLGWKAGCGGSSDPRRLSGTVQAVRRLGRGALRGKAP